ncbi:hypothetical protein [Schinkia azotoformans]|uniref:hypothetical protein n=1 Tax=Schinkia azotoformans TaxID=1454 RepID=UPI002DB8115D|nr:hypothetical protein [Schinkia azotoformans]MEC1714706.1 hypothetical protein [Schinkia azotoformans]MEC1757538.1 hypothetical protein [Schinkia azotoformans]
MTKEQIEILAERLIGLKQSEWTRIKQQVDMIFSSKAAKVELDDLSELKKTLEVGFNLRRYIDS